MNEFERRALDIAQFSSYLATYARTDRKIVDVEYYAYNFETSVIAALGATQNIIQIQSDSDFVLQYMSGTAVVSPTGTLTNNPNVTCQVTDTGSGKTLYSNPALLGLTFGTQGFPFLTPAPRVFSPNTNIKFDFVNRSSTTAYLVSVVLFGARIYYAG